MARRSARLQKRSHTPSTNESFASTAEHLPPVAEANEVIAGKTELVAKKDDIVVQKKDGKITKTERKVTEKVVERSEVISELRQPTAVEPIVAATTPSKSKSSKSLTVAARTPSNRTPIKPSEQEMHPEHHHPSTAKIMDEARWLGFHALGAHTASSKGQNTNPLAIAQATPTKATTNTLTSIMRSPGFSFKFRVPLPELSPQSSRILKDVSERAGRSVTTGSAPDNRAVVSSQRKFAVPQPKTSRFSDAHMAQFKKMDSIANHPSVFRADPNRFKPVGNLKRSPSKANLDKPDSPVRPASSSVKRTQLKMDTTAPASSNKSVAQSKSTIRIVPPSSPGPSASATPAKRVKRNERDDAATTRSVSGVESSKPNTPRRPHKSAFQNTRSRLMTPTKSSLARSQSVKLTKSAPMDLSPSQLRAPANMDVVNGTSGIPITTLKYSNTIHTVKSILRAPSRKFSDDPSKVAAGTHMMSPPPGLDLDKALPDVPTTVRKRVNFSASTLEKSEERDVGSPSPTKQRVSSAPSVPVAYPKLQPVSYPKLPDIDEDAVAPPSRRLTFTGVPGSMPGQFDFTSNKTANFGTPTKGTIRLVGNPEPSPFIDANKKRRLGTVEEASDKENGDNEEGRSAKKAKTSGVASPTKTPATPVSKLPRRLPNKVTGGLSRSRLAFLATPKRK